MQGLFLQSTTFCSKAHAVLDTCNCHLLSFHNVMQCFFILPPTGIFWRLSPPFLSTCLLDSLLIDCIDFSLLRFPLPDILTPIQAAPVLLHICVPEKLVVNLKCINQKYFRKKKKRQMPNGFNRERKLRSGVNLVGALKRKGLKQGLGSIRNQ